MKAIAFDRLGSPMGIGTMVRVDDGNNRHMIGNVLEVTYTRDGRCMLRVCGCKSRVSTEYVTVVRFTDFEHEIVRTFMEYGVKVDLDDVEAVSKRLGLAYENDLARRIIDEAAEGDREDQ